jgi:hypothetical protein
MQLLALSSCYKQLTLYSCTHYATLTDPGAYQGADPALLATR